MLSYIGGLINVLFVVFGTLMTLYNKLNMELFVINEIYDFSKESHMDVHKRMTESQGVVAKPKSR